MRNSCKFFEIHFKWRLNYISVFRGIQNSFDLFCFLQIRTHSGRRFRSLIIISKSLNKRVGQRHKTGWLFREPIFFLIYKVQIMIWELNEMICIKVSRIWSCTMKMKVIFILDLNVKSSMRLYHVRWWHHQPCSFSCW